MKRPGFQATIGRARLGTEMGENLDEKGNFGTELLTSTEKQMERRSEMSSVEGNYEDTVGCPQVQRSCRRQSHPPSHHHLHRSNIDMDSRGPLSRLKKAVKRLASRRKPDRPGANIGGDSVSPMSTPPGPEPHIVAGDGEGGGVDTDGQQACSTMDDLPRPGGLESAPAGGGENDKEGEVDQRFPRMHSDAEVVAGDGPGGE